MANGASLVPDIGPFTQGIAGLFQQRRAKKEGAEQTRQLLETATQAGRGDPEAMARLALFNPQAATAVSEALERNDQAELEATRAQSEKSVRNAIAVQSTPFGQRPNEFIRLAQEARQQGDIQGAENILRIANLPEPEQDLELQKIVIQNDDIKRVTERATAPKRNTVTQIGKINQDIESGAITPEQGDALLSEQLRDPNSLEVFLEGLARDKARILQEQNLKLQDPTEQLALQQLNLNLEAKKASIQENKEQKKAAEGLKGDTLRLVNELLSNEEGIKAFVGPLDQLTGDFALGGKTLDARTKINQLLSILTAENLKLMTGVLSESDLIIIRGVAGGGLDVSGNEDSFINELRRLQISLGKQGAIPSPSAPGTVQEGTQIGRFTVKAL